MSDQILLKALQRLNQPEKFDKYWAYLSGEWLSSKEDLTIAAKDEHVWSELKLPVRLKIEIKSILEEDLEDDSLALTSANPDSKTSYSEEEITNAWTLYYSDEHQAYYYYNSITGESQWAASEDYQHYDETSQQRDNGNISQSPNRVFSKPKVQKGISQTFVKGNNDSYDEDDEDGGNFEKEKSNSKYVKSQSQHSQADKRYAQRDDDSDIDDEDDDSYYSSSSDHSDESDSSEHYIISEDPKSKPEKLKVETYSLPKDKPVTTSSGVSPAKSNIGFTNKFKEHLHMDDEYDDMAVPIRSTRDQSHPSAPVDYEQTLLQYRQNTKLMSGNDVNSQTPVLAKKHSGANRRDTYMREDNLRNIDEKLTPKSSPAFGTFFPTPVLDHGEVYDAPNTHEVVDGMNDLLLRELAMGYSNGLLPHAPSSPPPVVASAKLLGDDDRPTELRRYPVRPKADTRLEDVMEQQYKQRGIKDILSDAVGVHKKPPIPGNLPNHIDALHGQPLSPVRRKEEKEISDVQKLVSLGFNERAVKFALQMSDGNMDEAREMLMESQAGPDANNQHYNDNPNDHDVDIVSEPIMVDTVNAVLVDDHRDNQVPTATDPMVIADAAEEAGVNPPKKKKSGIKKLLKMFK
jgi:hypothetical protein